MLTRVYGRTLLAGRRKILDSKLALYRSLDDVESIESFQVDRFNRIWGRARVSVPFYRWWAAEHALPARITTPSDLASFPVLDKSILIAQQDLVFAGDGVTGAYTTGGSSGQPTRFPSGKGEHDERWANVYAARSWSGIAPLERTVHLWGHSHLFGAGMRGRVAQARRVLGDRVVGITRLDAYDLSDAALAHDLDVLRRQKPAVVSGYASAVFRMARFAERNGVDIGPQPHLHGIVLCAETVTGADIETIERVLGAPAVVEYGAAETGVVAMSGSTTDDIRLLWDSFICLTTGSDDITLTTLSPRVFPLINYGIGDRVETRQAHRSNALSFRRILGRRQDVVCVSTSGGPIELSAILPVHILKSHQGVIGVQFEQMDAGRLRIHVETDRAVGADMLHAFFVRELRRDYPTVQSESIEVVLAHGPSTTLAGKHALFLRSERS